MKHIERIHIENARRFGKETVIDFGKGATIILAPNGTGKTTIFESIELALTGSIKRIENSQNAIIRDGMSEMKVRLDFSEDKFCQTILSREGGCIKSGSHDDLFMTENKSSIPYLYRLTHFLEQHGKEWLVEKKDKDAGDILKQLPVGKDIRNILSKKTSLTRAIGMLRSEVETSYSSACEELNRIKDLIAQRNKFVEGKELKPLEDIVAEIVSIAQLINYESYNGRYSVESIHTYSEKIKTALRRQYNDNSDFEVSLNELRSRVELYTTNLKIIKEKGNLYNEYLATISESTENITSIKNSFLELENSLKNIKKEQEDYQQIKSQFESLDNKSNHAKVLSSKLDENEKKLVEMKNRYKQLDSELKNIDKLKDRQNLINESIVKEKQLLIQVESLSEYLQQWEELSGINKNIIEFKLPEIKKKEHKLSDQELYYQEKIKDAEIDYMKKKNTLDSLNEASSVIQDAVSKIRANVGKNQRKCPVCNADYEPIDLIVRIDGALNRLNPAIPIALEEEQKALNILNELKEHLKTTIELLNEIRSEIRKEEKILELNRNKIQEVINPKFPEYKTPNDAKDCQKRFISQHKKNIEMYEQNKLKLDPILPAYEYEELLLSIQSLGREVDELTTANDLLKNNMDKIKVELSGLEMELKGKDETIITKEILRLTKIEKEKTKKIQDLEIELTKTESRLNNYNRKSIEEKDSLSKLNSIQDGIYTEWIKSGFEGLPNVNLLLDKQKEIKEMVAELGRTLKNFDFIDENFVNWRTAEKLQEANREIKRITGSKSEESFLDEKTEKVNKEKTKLDNINIKIKAVNKFLSEVVSSSEKVNEELNSINDPWKKLLKRIVINPLISNAPLLSNTTYRNIPKAKTSAVLHEEEIDIYKIASEAQLTDLQLTLMLSMAIKYQWTPWKGLLLDDPTQHHDLVHASSVFDVLRDYILDLEYQILMSTHDSTQARFFQRKLENEGIESKIYQLVAHKSGVVAQRIT